MREGKERKNRIMLMFSAPVLEVNDTLSKGQNSNYYFDSPESPHKRPVPEGKERKNRIMLMFCAPVAR